MRRFLLLVEVSDDGRGNNPAPDNVEYLLNSDKDSRKYLSQIFKKNADPGIHHRILFAEELIP